MLNGLWGLINTLNSCQNRSKTKLVNENTFKREHISCSIRVNWAAKDGEIKSLETRCFTGANCPFKISVPCSKRSKRLSREG